MDLHVSTALLENGEQQAALHEIRDLLLEQREIKRSQTVLLRVLAIALLAVSLVVILAAAILIPKAVDTLDQIQAAAEALHVERMDAILDNLETFAAESVGIVSQADEILSGISDIDFAQLNSAIENLDGAVQAFSDLDVETLNEAIANLNSTIQPLANFLNRFR